MAFGQKKAFTKDNIIKGFRTIGIYLLRIIVMDYKVGPSQTYQRRGEKRSLNGEKIGTPHSSWMISKYKRFLRTLELYHIVTNIM